MPKDRPCHCWHPPLPPLNTVSVADQRPDAFPFTSLCCSGIGRIIRGENDSNSMILISMNSRRHGPQTDV